MPTAEAHVATDRASRYLAQLCRHLGQMPRTSHRPPAGHGDGRMPPTVQHVDCGDTRGTVRFSDGQWTLAATADVLVLRIEAEDEDALQRLQTRVAARVEKIGRRDGLHVHWQRPEAATPGPTPPEPTGEEDGALRNPT